MEVLNLGIWKIVVKIMIKVKSMCIFISCRLEGEGSEVVRVGRFIFKVHKIMSQMVWTHRLWINRKINLGMFCIKLASFHLWFHWVVEICSKCISIQIANIIINIFLILWIYFMQYWNNSYSLVKWTMI